jgi:NAD(P)-dependent dehydrogenase (short-subunit alcohol dehydrogenase family)
MQAPKLSGAAAPWRVVWITGASSGIGRALALSLARDGARVAVSARSPDKLAELAASHPNIRAFPLDVRDRDAAAQVLAEIEGALGPVDLAVLNAGVWHPMTSVTFDAALIEESMAVNFMGLVNPLAALLPAMRARGAGHIALVSSVAGYLGLPRGVAYGPSKAAATTLAEALAADAGRFGIKVSVINPGFVDTPMTKVNEFPMPWIMTVDEAVARIRKGLTAGRFEIAFPWQMVLFLKLAKRMPYWLLFSVFRRMLPIDGRD